MATFIYEYYCGDCEVNFTSFRSMDLRQTCVCPQCGEMASKVISKVTFHLPGVDTAYPSTASKWDDYHIKGNMDELKRLGAR